MHMIDYIRTRVHWTVVDVDDSDRYTGVVG